MNKAGESFERGKEYLLNVPNALCAIRIVGSLILVLIAIFEQPIWFVALYVALGITDLIDGPLARRFKQQSMAGAKLDSIADILLTIALLTGVCYLRWELVSGELYWLFLPAISYAVAFLISYYKFGRLPALHTLLAKINHFLVAVAGLCLLLNLSSIPLRIVCVTTLIANLEIIAIVTRMRNWRTDVISFYTFVHSKNSTEDSAIPKGG